MKKPEIGQVLATASGQQFRVVNVTSTADPDEPETDGDFAVLMDEVRGLHSLADSGELDLLDFEFEAWCETNGVRY